MRNLFLIACVFLLAACAQQSHVQLYPGQSLPENQVLTLVVPYELEVHTLNGQHVPKANAMFGTQDKTLHLQPGQYEISAFYKNGFDVNGGMSHEVVRSQIAVYHIEGKAGEVWQLEFDKPANLQEARELEKNFTSWAVNKTSGERVEAQASQRSASLLSTLVGGGVVESPTVVEPLDAAPAVTPVMPVPVAAPTPAPAADTALPHNDAVLTTLQQMWQLLNEDSRAAFLEWATQ